MTIDQLIPSVNALSHAEKIRLVQIVLEQLACQAPTFSQSKPTDVDGLNPLQGSVSFEKDIVSPMQGDGATERARERFDPQRFYGLAHQSRQAVDQYLAEAREDWHE